jgi:hypothetical protein
MKKDIKEDTSETEIEKDYSSNDVRHVLVQANFHFWGEVVDWLQKNGAADKELNPQKVNLMMRDFRNLSDEGASFTTDQEEATRLAKETR